MNNPDDGLARGFDWDPRDEAIVRDQVAAYDALRERCPVAHSEVQGWSLLRHGDVLAALHDPATFSSRVSVHVAVPNGMDGAEHAAFRAVVDRAFTPSRVAGFAPELARIAAELVSGLAAAPRPVEVMAALGEPYAALAQCSYLGWPPAVAAALRVWASQSAQATRARDRAELDRVAAQFDRIIAAELDRAREQDGPRALTNDLLEERVDGRALTDAELVSMVRNWTAGELGTIAAAVGIVVEFLARRPDVQALLRAQPDLRQVAMDEMLRLEPPLVANRRRTARPVEVAGRVIPEESRVTILWPGVQRDPAVFADPAQFRLDRDAADNLLYGRGPHYCPGEGLSRLELGVLLDAVLAGLPEFALAGAPARASYPSGGFTTVHVTWPDAADRPRAPTGPRPGAGTRTRTGAEPGPAPVRRSVPSTPLSAARARVLAHVHRSGEVCVDEVAAAFGQHPNTVREHLDELVRTGMLERTRTPGPGRGRPAWRYRVDPLRPEPDPRVREYRALAGALAAHIAGHSADPRAEARAAGARWGRMLVEPEEPTDGTTAGPGAGGPTESSGVGAGHARVVRMLDDLGFGPRPDRAGSRITLTSCPILEVARQHPEVVCAVHEGMVESALRTLGVPAEEVSLRPFATSAGCLLTMPARG